MTVEPPSPDFETGRGLVFMVAGAITGSTMVRMMLGAHPQIHAPGETWLLFTLNNMISGTHKDQGPIAPKAARMLGANLDRSGLGACCHKFAAEFYKRSCPAGARVYVDKSTRGFRLWPWAAELFPEAKFIVLMRDPRAVLWTRRRPPKTPQLPVQAHARRLSGIFVDTARAADELGAARRAELWRYEDVCRDPEHACERLCSFLGLEPHIERMVSYGEVQQVEGGGNFKALQHTRPHTSSIRNWGTAPGEIDAKTEQVLADACGRDRLARFGYHELAHAGIETPVPGT